MGEMEKFHKEFETLLLNLGKEFPKFTEAFMEFFKAAEEKGALDQKTKELISVALAVKSQCPFCIAFHVKNALKLGATEREILESTFLAVLMGGGPSLAYTYYVFKALEEFKGKKK